MEWRPNAGRQYEFLEAVASGEFHEVGYGGARGGGKTDGGIMALLYEKEHPRYRALVIRKNSKDLNDWCDRAERWYTSQGAKRVGSPPEFDFYKGAKVRTGHLKDKDAYGQYQGHEYQRILIEELTQIAREEDYLKLTASCRSTIPELRPCVISTFNPDGPGFSWVKRRFGLHGIPTKPVVTIDPLTKLKRIFIPAKLEDNPHLSTDPTYRAVLDGLPDGLREAWRDGSWDEPIIAGAYYTNEILQAQKEGRIKLVPFDPRLKVHTVWDLGIDDSMTIWFVQKTSQEIRIIGYYQNEGYGLPHYAGKLQEYREKNGWVYGKHFAPHDANKREITTGKTIIQTAAEPGIGIEFIKVPKVSIESGITKVRLMFPRVFFSIPAADTGLNALRNYRKEWDEKLLKFKDEPLHDWASHAADGFRYLSLIEDQMTNEDRPQSTYKQPEYESPSFTSRKSSNDE